MATTGDDLIYGGASNDALHGLAGNDIIYAFQNDDIVYGGLGDDAIETGAGDDTAYGGAGDDTVVVAQTQNAAVFGGAGIDTLLLSWPSVFTDDAVSIDFRSGFASATDGSVLNFVGMEELFLLAGYGNDTVIGGARDDFLSVAGGANRVNALSGDDVVAYIITGVANTLNGGSGNDVLLAQSDNSPLYFIVDGSNGRVDDGSLSVITGFEHYEAYGGSLADIASLGAGDDAFRGGGGNDTGFGMDGQDFLMGITGDDLLYGGAGNDTLYGGDGNDVINGGQGQDIRTGGAGADVFVFGLTENSLDTITDFTSGEDHIRYAGAGIGIYAPDLGPLDPGDLQIGGSTSTPGVFVLQYDSGTDTSDLLWSGTGNGAYLLMRFTGEVSMVASDIILF